MPKIFCFLQKELGDKKGLGRYSLNYKHTYDVQFHLLLQII